MKDFKSKARGPSEAKQLKPVVRYTDFQGRRKYQGTKDLTKTGCLDWHDINLFPVSNVAKGFI